jgi:serine/threonine protein kinase
MSLDCPSPDELDRLLRDEVSESDRDDLELHITECCSCQQQLVERPHIDDWKRLLDGPSQPGFFVSTASVDTARHVKHPTAPVVKAVSRDWLNLPGFNLLDEIGHGGSGVVFAAWQAALGRMVAVKVLPESATHLPDRQLRFRNEARVFGQLQHAGIVAVYDSGESQGRAWIAQELCSGGTLTQRIQRTPQPGPYAADIVRQLAIAVQHAHDAGIIHRDIKPDNVLFQNDVPKLADFGLARILDADTGVTRTADVMGTPSYMAPEQARGDRDAIGTACDIYALGGVLYELLVGSPPFAGASVMDTLRLVLDREPVPPRQFQPNIPRDLETICLKCLEKDVSRRYRQASELADELQRFLDGVPILARPTSLIRRVTKWARRKPAVAALSSVSVLSVVAGLTVWGQLTMQLEEANDELRTSNTELAERTDDLTLATQQAQAKEAEARKNLERQIAANAALQEVLDFFTNDLFDAATPEQRGINLTVLEVLDEADQKINARNIRRPDVESSLRLAIGNTLSLIGQPNKAVVHLERADALFQELGEASSPAFDCRMSLARCLRGLRHKDRANKLLKDLTSDRWAPDNVQRLRLAHDLHDMRTKDQSLEDKLAALDALIAESRETLGDTHPTTLSMLSSKAETWFRAGRFDEALQVYRDELRENETSLGENHPNTWSAANNVAVTLIRLGKLDEAEEIHQENLRRQLMYRGPRDVGTMGTKHNLSMIQWRQNKRQAAIDLLLTVIPDKAAALGPVESRTLQSLYQIGRMYQETKQHAEGYACFVSHFQPYLESARPIVVWVDLLTVFGQLATEVNELETATASLKQARELLDSMGNGFAFQHKTLESAETALTAALSSR